MEIRRTWKLVMENHKRDKWIQVRITPQERALLHQAADAEGSTLSAWVRRTAIVQARKTVKPS